MKKYLLLLVLLVHALSIASCNISDLTPPEESDSKSQPEIFSAENIKKADDGNRPVDSGGEYDICPLHDANFHSIPADLVLYIGESEFNTWFADALSKARTMDDYNHFPCGSIGITDVIQKFDISKEEFIKIVRPPLPQETIDFYAKAGITMTDELFYSDSYTLEQIDAFYSNDYKRINEVICGPLSVYNETDGKLYSIHWLADHSAADYVQADIPMDEVTTLLQKVKKDYSDSSTLLDLAQDAQATLSSAIALQSELSVEKPATEAIK